MKPKSALHSFLALAGSSILAHSTATAANIYWDGASASWNNVANWSTDATGATDPGALPLVSDDLFFNITGLNNAQNITLDANQIAKSLTFNSTGATNFIANSFGTTARTLTLGGNITINSGAGPVIIGASPATYGAVNLFLDANQSWTNSSTSVLSVKSDVNLNGKTLTLSNGPLSISGNITGGTLALSGTNFRRVLSGTNSFESNLSVNSTGSSVVGILAITSIANSNENSSIGKNNTITLGNGTASPGRLEYIGTASSESDRAFKMSAGTASSQIYNNGSGTLTFDATTFNTVNGTGTRNFHLGGSNTGNNEIRGIIIDNASGVLNLTKTGIGTWVLGGDNSYTGSTTLNAGTLKLNYDTSANGTNSSKLSNTATTGTLLLNGGTLELSGGSHIETVDSTTLTLGTTFIKQTGGTSTLSMGVINFTSGAINFSAANIATTTTGTASTFLSQRATVAGTNFAMKDASNNYIVAYDYVTNGSTGYTGGAMTTDFNYSIIDGTSITADRGAATNTLKITTTAASSIAISDTRTFILGSMLFAGAHNYEISTAGTGKIAVNRLHNYGAGTLTLGTLGSMGTTGLSLYGTGKTILNGGTAGNDYNLTIAGGTLQFSNKLQLGPNTTGRVITLDNGTLLADTSGGNIAIENNTPGSASRTFTLGAGGGTLDVIGGNKLTVPGVISGADGQLIIGGASSNGTVELTAANTYTGATTIKGGTLEVSAGNINSTTSVTINGGVLKYGSTTGLTKDVTVAGGTFRYNSSVAYSGALTFTSGSIGGTNLTGSLDNLTVGVNQTLSPGNSPGTATTGSQTWAGGGSYAWEINDANATAGADPGWDLLSGTGTLTITATSGSKFNLNLFALLTSPADTQGILTDFNNATSYDWLIADFANAVSGFSADAFNINATNFVNNNPINGSFAIALGNTVSGGDNTQIYLTYTAIPEPNAAALLGSLGMLMLLRRRRN